MKLLPFLATTLVLTGPAFAQTVPTKAASSADIGLTFTATNGFAGTPKLYSGAQRYGDVLSDDFALAVSRAIPLPAMGADTSLNAGLSYSRTKFSLRNNVGALPLPQHVQSLTLDLSFSQKIDETWSALVGTATGFHTAGSGGFKSNGLGVDLFALGLYRYGPTLTFAGGGGYASLATGRNRLEPAVGVQWDPTPKWSVAFGYPTTGVTCKFTDAFSLGFVATGTGGTYYVERDPLPGAAGKPNLDRTPLEFYDVRLGLAATWKINRALSLTANVGAVERSEFNYHARRFKIKSDGGGAYASFGLTAAF